MKLHQFALLLALGAACFSCGTSPDPVRDLAYAQDIDVAQASVPEPGLLCAGQLTEAQIDALVEAGYKSFLSLRGPDEKGVGEDGERAASHGATFVRFAIQGADGISEENARHLDSMLAELERPAVLYCGSSNRVGALLGARAYFVQGKSRQESLEFARSAGMTRLEGRLEELLGE